MKNNKVTLKIITAFDENFAALGKHCSNSIINYAKYHHFDYGIYNVSRFDRPPAWAKIECLIREAKLKIHDYILWVDADAIFVRLDENILFQLPKDKDIFMCNHLVSLENISGCLGLSVQCERPNTGVILVKTTDWSINFLEQVWAQTDFINHGWWEQAAFHKLMGYSFEISDRTIMNQPVENVMSHIGWLDNIWNAVPTTINKTVTGKQLTQYPYRPVIIHFAGCLNEVRIKEMGRY
jgi:lipopolysaccharide biosynthesis glycosyltransferase